MTKGIALGTALLVASCWTVGCGDDGALDDGGQSSDEVPCPETIPPFVATASDGLEAAGEDGLITAKLIDADWKPPRVWRNDWTLLFRNAEGEPLDDIEIEMARPWMAVHGHDGEFPPTITKLDESGTVQFDDINFARMSGPGEVQIEATAASAGSDYIVFDVCVGRMPRRAQ